MPDETKPGEMPTQPESETPKAEAPSVDSLKAENERLAAALKERNKEEAARRKRLEELETRYKQDEEAKLSEMDKLSKRLAETEAKLKAKERAEAQRMVADEVGLPHVFADRLQGETLEDLKADAKKILDALPKQPKGLSPTNPPNGSPGETEAQKRARILGRPMVNVFDPEQAARLGGGVVWKEPTDK